MAQATERASKINFNARETQHFKSAEEHSVCAEIVASLTGKILN